MNRTRAGGGCVGPRRRRQLSAAAAPLSAGNHHDVQLEKQIIEPESLAAGTRRLGIRVRVRRAMPARHEY
jgi:hypothetical protein